MTEERKIDLRKNVFSKAQYLKTIDTNFNELGVTTIIEDIQNTPTVQSFFNLYDQLFYEIPETGATNSHEYLVKTSGEYINFTGENEEIQALREEITQLRQNLLQQQIENVRLISGENVNNEEIQQLQNQIQSPSGQEVLSQINQELSIS
jgi:uncharacterized protein YnzC (UPF0291/DUF896 family)